MATIETLFSRSSRFEAEYFEEILLDAKNQQQKTELTLNQGSFRKKRELCQPHIRGKNIFKRLHRQRSGVTEELE